MLRENFFPAGFCKALCEMLFFSAGSGRTFLKRAAGFLYQGMRYKMLKGDVFYKNNRLEY